MERWTVPAAIVAVALAGATAFGYFSLRRQAGELRAMRERAEVQARLSEARRREEQARAPAAGTGRAPALAPAPGDPPRPSAAPVEVPTPESRRLAAALRRRFPEAELKAMAQQSVAAEDAARAEHGETEEAYAAMQAAWAELCKAKGITEEERQALEDEAIRSGWIAPEKD
ncbi:MAG: hypothetical protein HZA54_05605 [Planctomycetes bacterium]|nr:hypothetical protein [Planctomycetota bacterium]